MSHSGPDKSTGARPLRVRVPATTANLGPGYDLIGAALNLYNQFDFAPADDYSLQLAGPLAAECKFGLTPDSLIRRAFELVYREVGLSAPSFALRQDIDVPPSRGLGSSSTAIVAALLAANQWLDSALGQADLLRLATQLEGHPDNVAPALLGGCILNFPGGGWTRLPVPESLYWIVCIPDFELETIKARGVVPERVSRDDAVCNMAYLGALVAGFCLKDSSLIKQGLQDTLHQPFRQALVPGMPDVLLAATDAGALGAVLSGAGPTLLALSEQFPAQVGEAMVRAWAGYGIAARFVTCIIDLHGAVCLD
ncbi:MAG: homoserine kinase [Candidatus Melainabacteria bacterium HGW-Melainabacteria-1]|nr:MAG: homoserine kinase [Candidatus Melainabacteria bacterium HGW-Melainabacteria-1]